MTCLCDVDHRIEASPHRQAHPSCNDTSGIHLGDILWYHHLFFQELLDGSIVWRILKEEWRLSVNPSWKLPSYPSPKPTLTFASHLGKKGCLREGFVGSFPETYNDPLVKAFTKGRYFIICLQPIERPIWRPFTRSPIEHSYMTSRPPYWCPKLWNGGHVGGQGVH